MSCAGALSSCAAAGGCAARRPGGAGAKWSAAVRVGPFADAAPKTEPVRRGQISWPQPALLFNTTDVLWPQRKKIHTIWGGRGPRDGGKSCGVPGERGRLHPRDELFQSEYFFPDVTWKETVRKLSKCVNNTVSGGEKSVIRNSCSSKLSNSVIL